MFNRRNLFGLASAVAGLGLVSGAQKAQAKADLAATAARVPRGKVGYLKRLPTVDLESRHDFLTGMMAFVNSDMAKASRNRTDALAQAVGYKLDQDVPLDTAMKLFDSDPIVGLRTRMWNSAHNHEHYLLDREFQANADTYLAEMEAASTRGPGKCELNPDLAIPEYTRYEIHQQPGGYHGNAFAGHIYHYATNQFYRGTNDQDERHKSYAAACPSPADGKVLRILDLGCGIGQLATSMKARYPNAEVHAIDVAAPMLRYAHMRAADMGADVNFAQRLAEDTRYPDGHFDIVISYILFHEVTGAASKKIMAEVGRILRPGGVFYPIDFNHVSAPSPGRLYGKWVDHRWNTEPWTMQWGMVDTEGELRKAGFQVDDQSVPNGVFGKVIGVKKA